MRSKKRNQSQKGKTRKKLINLAVLIGFIVVTLVIVGTVTSVKAGPKAIYIAPNLSNVADVVIARNWEKVARQLGIEAVVKSSENDSKREADEWDLAIAAGYDAIVAAPVDSSAIVSSIKKANAAGIPVFALGRIPDKGKVILSTRADNWSLGTFAAEEVVRRLIKKHGEPRGLVLQICGVVNINGRLRKESMDAVFNKYPKIKVIWKTTKWLEKEFYDHTKSVASVNPDLDAIVLGTDVIYGVDAALKSLGKLKKIGDPGHIIIVGIDADPRILGLMKEDLWDASALQDMVGYGTVLAHYMKDFFDGKFMIKTSQMVMKDYDPKTNRFRVKEGKLDAPGKVEHGSLIKWSEEPEGWQILTPSRIIDKNNADDPTLWGNMKDKL